MTTLSCPPPNGGPRFEQDGPATAGAESPVARSKPSLARSAALMGVGALAGLFLAACGGDGNGSPPPAPPPPPSNEVPASAAATDASLEAFAIGLAPSDNTEPLMLDNVPTFPSSETEEPIAVP